MREGAQSAIVGEQLCNTRRCQTSEALKVIRMITKSILEDAGDQCRDTKIGVVWSQLMKVELQHICINWREWRDFSRKTCITAVKVR